MNSVDGPLFQIGALLGMPAGLNEMLLQERAGTILLFPALPKGRTASFHQLLATAGVLVSAQHDGKKTTGVLLRFWRSATVQLQNPFHGEEAIIRQGDHEWRSSESLLIISGEPNLEVVLESR